MSHTQNLKLDGHTAIRGCFSAREVKTHVAGLEAIARQNQQNLDYTSGEFTTFTPNFFRHDVNLLGLVDIPAVDEILRVMIDDDYVLVACNAINRSKGGPNESSVEVGQNWHTDSRYVGGKRMQAGIFFSVVVMLDDFTTENGATLYSPNSHLRSDRPVRNAKYPAVELTGKSGDVIIFDSGLWHKGGKSSSKRRWGVFNLYGPWFIKPYFDFPKMMQGRDLSSFPNSAKLLHFNSIPPRDETERFTTLVKPNQSGC